MTWAGKIFAYCERGTNAAFWAEPWNAISNLAFLVAAASALLLWLKSPRESRGVVELILIAIVGLIGIGSFMFHTFATRWAAIADTAPIGIFMLAYAGYALRRYLSLDWWKVAASLLGFVLLLAAASAAPCPPPLRQLVQGGACLNGSLGYVPALAMLAGVSAAAYAKGHPAAPYLLAAAIIFSASLTARTLDQQLCGNLSLFGRPRGTHALWHVLNASLLWILLVSAIRHGSPTQVQAVPEAKATA